MANELFVTDFKNEKRYVVHNQATKKTRTGKKSSVITPHAKNTQNENNEYNEKIKSFDIDEVTKKYEKNPIKVFNELGLELSEEEEKEIGQYIKDKKSLKAFLILVKEAELSKDDIVAGVKILKTHKIKGYWERVKKFTNTLFTEGVIEAFDVAMSERLHRAKKLSENMGDVRTQRKDFSSNAVAVIAAGMEENPSIKPHTMHFVCKKTKNGTFVYTEFDTTHAMNYMIQHPKVAAKFVSNAAELESITTPDGEVKYKGSTIINVDVRMTEKPELKGTMIKTALKSDMNDEFLNNITENLFKNPDMEKALQFELNAKTKDGKDRFTASDINNSSTFLLDKSQTECNNYTQNLETLTQNEKLSGSQIVEISRKIHENPESKSEILAEHVTSKPKTVFSTETIIKEEKAQEKEEKTLSILPQATENSYNVFAVKTNSSNPMAKQQVYEIKEMVQIEGNNYDREVVFDALYKKYGPDAVKILNNIEDKPFIEMMKKYGNNRTLVAALAQDPTVIKKIRTISPNLTNGELADMVSLCKDTKNTQTMIELAKVLSPHEAIKCMTLATRANTVSELLDIMQNNEMSLKQKKESISGLTGKELAA